MKVSSIRIISLLVLVVCLASTAMAQVPDMNVSFATSANFPNWTSVYTLPNGMGNTMVGAGAQITLTMLDVTGAPCPGIIPSDMWIETGWGGLVLCPYNWPPGTWPGYVSIADMPTNNLGQTTFSNSVFGGGWSDLPNGEPCIIRTIWGKVNGTMAGGPLNSDMPIGFNSPDINGDMVVNLSDVAQFASVYFGTYAYRADFFWDGIINLSDLVLMAQGFGATCP